VHASLSVACPKSYMGVKNERLAAIVLDFI
jgi:hypothetical protein